MTVVLVAGQIVLLLGMFAVSVWGWRNLDADIRVRMRGDTTTGIDWTMGKKTMLLMRPLIGCLFVAAALAVQDQSSGDLIGWLGLVSMAIFLVVHWSSVRRAAR